MLDIANNVLESAKESAFNPLVAALDEHKLQITPHIHKYGSERMEARGVLRDIKAAIARGVPLSEIAVLSRQSMTTYTLERDLAQEGIAYVKYGGTKLTAKKNIRQFLAFLELALDRFNWLAWESLLPMVPLIGAELTARLVEDLSYNTNWDWGNPPSFSIGSGKRWKNFSQFWRMLAPLAKFPELDSDQLLPEAFRLFSDIYRFYWQGASDEDKAAAYSESALDMAYMTDLNDVSGYNTQAKEALKQGQNTKPNYDALLEQRLKEVDEYIVKLALTRKEELRQFLNQFQLDDSQTVKTEEETMVVSTIHSAKGLEWDFVVVMGLEEGTLPPAPRVYGQATDPEAAEACPGLTVYREPPYIEEEQRLLYVAMTRAREELHLSISSQRLSRGMKNSRFVKDWMPKGPLGGTIEMPTHQFTLEKMMTAEEEERAKSRFRDKPANSDATTESSVETPNAKPTRRRQTSDEQLPLFDY